MLVGYCHPQGELAHLVERVDGIDEVTGSIPVFSTPEDQVRFLSHPRMGVVAQRGRAPGLTSYGAAW
jgi:hypothetical protein